MTHKPNRATACFCTTCQLRMDFSRLKGCKKKKKEYATECVCVYKTQDVYLVLYRRIFDDPWSRTVQGQPLATCGHEHSTHEHTWLLMETCCDPLCPGVGLVCMPFSVPPPLLTAPCAPLLLPSPQAPQGLGL